MRDKKLRRPHYQALPPSLILPSRDPLTQRAPDTLIFRSQSPPPPPSDWLVVSLASKERFRLIDAPPQPVRDAIVAAYGADVKGHGVEGSSWEVKLKMPSRTWVGTEEFVAKTVQMLDLLRTLDGFGWVFCGSVARVDALYFHRRRD